MVGFSTDLPRQILKCLQCAMWTAVPEIGFRAAQDPETLFYVLGRVLFIGRVRWQPFDGL
jgi:hypothetical protein